MAKLIRPRRKSSKSDYKVGYRNPPRETQFRPGQSGNPKGRPKGAKNFATVFNDELNGRVPVTENGKRKKITKREAITKQVINKAAGGDLKAVQTVLTEARYHETNAGAGSGISLTVFDKPEHGFVISDIVHRIRLMEEEPHSDAEEAHHRSSNSRTNKR